MAVPAATATGSQEHGLAVEYEPAAAQHGSGIGGQAEKHADLGGRLGLADLDLVDGQVASF